MVLEAPEPSSFQLPRKMARYWQSKYREAASLRRTVAAVATHRLHPSHSLDQHRPHAESAPPRCRAPLPKDRRQPLPDSAH